MIRVNGLKYCIGDFEFRELSLSVEKGEYFILMGPPGAGKTMLLECITGLRRVHGGEILLDGRDVTALEPGKRGIGYVPQDYALFPHLKVEQNIAFGLAYRGVKGKEAAKKCRLTAESLGIAHLMGRSVNGLSGGEKQRVALARAIVLEPGVLLLDEPVSALNEAVRREILADLKSLHKRLGLTTIHVSHIFDEAFTVGDRAGILNRGVLQQTGTLPSLMRDPCNEFVAFFTGCKNILEGLCLDRQDTDAFLIRVGHDVIRAKERCKGGSRFIIRPENISVTQDKAGIPHGWNIFDVTVKEIFDHGSYLRLLVEASGFDIEAHVSPEEPFPRQGDCLFAAFSPDSVRLLD